MREGGREEDFHLFASVSAGRGLQGVRFTLKSRPFAATQGFFFLGKEAVGLRCRVMSGGRPLISDEKSTSSSCHSAPIHGKECRTCFSKPRLSWQSFRDEFVVPQVVADDGDASRGRF